MFPFCFDPLLIQDLNELKINQINVLVSPVHLRSWSIWDEVDLSYFYLVYQLGNIASGI